MFNKNLSKKEIIGFSLFIAILLILQIRSELTPSEPVKDVRTIHNAWMMCREFVQRRLKAPTTAEFPWSYDDKIKQLSENQFRAVAYVDAKNAMGVPLRAEFTCTVTYAGNDVWNLNELRINER